MTVACQKKKRKELRLDPKKLIPDFGVRVAANAYVATRVVT